MKKKIITFFISCFLIFNPSTIYANQTPNSSLKYVENQEMTLQFEFGPRNGFYTGPVKNNLPNGIGKFSSINESGNGWTYIGEWKNGHFNGYGMTNWENGIVNIGPYQDDYLSGNNSWLLDPGNCTASFGTVVLGELSGECMLLGLKERYIGELKNGLYEGTGCVYYETGQRYEGELSSGKISGTGTYHFNNESFFTGTFQSNNQNILNGEGTFFASTDDVGQPCKLVNGSLKFESTISSNNNSAEELYDTDTTEAGERLMNATVFKADVYNGIKTEVIGERAYIIFPKEFLRNITEKDYSEFINSNVKGKNYNWFSIICDDGTGIHFASSFSDLGTYGKLNNEGGITDALGFIYENKSGGYTYESN